MTRRPPLHELVLYVAAFGVVGLAAGLSYLAPALSSASPYTLFLLAAIIAARWCGLGPGLAAIIIGGVLAEALFVAPRPSLLQPHTAEVLDLVSYLVVGFVACWATSSLRSARERILRILDSISEGFTVVDRSWRVLYLNRAAADMARTPPTDLLGRNVLETLPGGAAMPFKNELRRAMTERRPTRIEVRVPGTGVWLETRIVPTEEGLSAFTRDVTDRKVTHHQLGITLSALARSNQELEKFARTMSHDLVQPLASITSFAELLKDSNPAEVERCANRIIEIGLRMAATLRQNLDAARTLGDPGAHEAVALDALVAEVAQELSGVLAGSGSSVTNDELPVVEADPVLMRQLLYSLILGAVGDGEPRRLKFSSGRDDEQWTLTLSLVPLTAPAAEAIPLRVEDHDEIMIARRIVELQGGRMEAEAAPDGTAHWIRMRLPAAMLKVRESRSAAGTAGK